MRHDKDDLDRLLRKLLDNRASESHYLEFKESFHWSDNATVGYARAMASFANHEGGFLVFGVDDKTRSVAGLSNANFEMRDPKDITEFLNQHFSPSFMYTKGSLEYDGHQLGYLHVGPSKHKPIICTKRNDKGKPPLIEGAIYYRYSGVTQTIRSSELHELINAKVLEERASWQSMFARMTQINPTSLALLNLESGEVQGKQGGLLISQESLEDINFILEGNFSESGERTLRVIGDVGLAEKVPIATDPSSTHPYLRKHLCQLLSDEFKGLEINGHALHAVKCVYNVEGRPEWYYRSKVGNSSPQYSAQYLGWLKEQFRADEKFFENAKKSYKELRTSNA